MNCNAEGGDQNGRETANESDPQHDGNSGGNSIVEETYRFGDLQCLVVGNVEKPKIAFIGFHDWNETARDIGFVAYEFFEQYPDVHATWVIPYAPYVLRNNHMTTCTWWPSSATNDPESEMQRRVEEEGVTQLCRYVPPNISDLRSSVTALFKAVEQQFFLASDRICLMGKGQGTIVALDALFYSGSIPRALGLWNPVPALAEHWRDRLATFEESWRHQIVNVPIFMQDNSTNAFRGICAQLVDCFLSYEGFKMTSFNDDHLGPQITPTDAGNFFRFVNPPRGWYVIKPIDTRRVTSIFSKGRHNYFCGWPFKGKAIIE